MRTTRITRRQRRTMPLVSTRLTRRQRRTIRPRTTLSMYRRPDYWFTLMVGAGLSGPVWVALTLLAF